MKNKNFFTENRMVFFAGETPEKADMGKKMPDLTEERNRLDQLRLGVSFEKGKPQAVLPNNGEPYEEGGKTVQWSIISPKEKKYLQENNNISRNGKKCLTTMSASNGDKAIILAKWEIPSRMISKK